MRNYWFISDTHFFHENSLKWEGRDHFSCVEEMNEHMIDNWNSVVKPQDNVYHLGDVWMGPSSHEERAKLWARLKGRKTLIVGNHDDIKYMSSGRFFRKISMWKVWHDMGLILTHVPIHESCIPERLNRVDGINVHGHTHMNGSPEGPYRSVCVELNDFTPVNLGELDNG